MSQTAANWMVVRTKPGREAWACENITAQGFTPYLPRTLARRAQRAYAQSLFGPYIFVQQHATGAWRYLLGTFGVTSVVLFGETPAVVRHDTILSIKAREVEGIVVLPPPAVVEPRWPIGQSIRVKGGVFSGNVGIYQGMAPKQRERVLLEFLGRKTSVLLVAEQLEAV